MNIFSTYWRVFRIVFVAFSLYLMGDAFYRWDGFKYYESFSAFLPSVALASILWSIAAALTTILVLTPLIGAVRFCQHIGLKIKNEHIILFTVVFLLSAALVLVIKKLMWQDLHTTLQIKISILAIVSFIAFYISWRVRNKSVLLNALQDNITPLVWIFGIFVLFSVPMVAYYSFFNNSEMVVSTERESALTEDRSRPNIILVTFDALTARDMSVYGYHRDTTPFLSEWVKTATMFTKLEASGNHTASTSATLMTGKRVWTHQRYHPHASNPFKSDTESLPLMLKKNGYFNMAFVANSIASVQELGMTNGFDIAPPSSRTSVPSSVFGYFNKLLYDVFADNVKLYNWILKEDFILYKVAPMYFKYPNNNEFPIEKVVDMFMTAKNGKLREPFFAWLHVYPPHAPYIPPEPFMGMFDSSPGYRTVKGMNLGWDDEKVLKIIRARYDEFIRYCDEQIKLFITRLNDSGLLNNSVIIVSSDHGESFEKRYIGHGGPYLYEQVTHLPLFVKEPGQTEGRIIDDPVEQVDIASTILDLAGIGIPEWMEGKSRVPNLRGKSMKSEPLLSMNFELNLSRGEQITNGTVAVWEGDYKLIHTFGTNESFLFNLREDPDEQHDLSDTNPEIYNNLLSLININLEKANRNIMMN